MQYSFTDEDDHTETLESDLPRAAFIAAVKGGDAELWGEIDSRPEDSGDGVWYVGIPCDCGDDGCEDHESSTRLLKIPEYNPADWDGLQGTHSGPGYLVQDWQALCEHGHYRLMNPANYGVKKAAHDAPWFAPDHLVGSDYSGGPVNRANFEVWCEMYAEGEDVWWTQLSGGHGTYCIVILKSECPYPAYRVLCGLQDYPCISDEKVSEVEQRMQDEAWEAWFESDFLAAIEERFSRRPAEGAAPDAVAVLFHNAAERGNLYWECTSDGAYIDCEKVAEHVDLDDLEGWEPSDD